MKQDTWGAVDEYFEEQLIGKDAALESALAASAAAGLPSIQVSACQGKMLYLLALARGANRILEIGTLGGYSTIWLARALPSNGQLVTLELEPHHAAVARQNFKQAGLAERIEVHVGPALDTLVRLREQRVAPFGLVFIDADKPNIPRYVQAALELSEPGTLIVVDNVVREGAIIAPKPDASATGVRQLVSWLAGQTRLSATAIQTVGNKGYDGFLLARVQR
ncbi:MAG: O-methyltransferase [Steroidobacteraceae bacterium]